LLIIEKSPGVLKELRALIGGHFRFEEFQSTTSAQKGLELARKSHPDLIVYDLPTRDSSDADIIREIRSALPDVAIVVLSLFDDYRSTVLRAGADVFVSKTEPRENLLASIGQLGKFSATSS
jgi:DNA-binding NarL/FixJ family response regulator